VKYYHVFDIDFDFEDGYEYPIPDDEKKEIVENNIGVWYADDEDDLIEEITASTGWCIKSIDYEVQLK